MRLTSLLPHFLYFRLKHRRKKSEKQQKRVRILADPTVDKKEEEWLWSHGFYPLEKRIYGLTEKNIKDYLDYRSYRPLHPINGQFSRLIDYKAFLPVIVPQPYRTKVHVVISDGHVRFAHGVDRRNAIQQLEQFAMHQGALAIRPSGGSGGAGFQIVSGRAIRSQLVKLIKTKGTHIITNEIYQHHFTKSIYSGSVNPLRVVVMRDVDTTEIFIVSASLRIGTDTSAPVSNAGAGGMVAPIDIETGTLSRGLQYVGNFMWWEKHPNTGAHIEGASIPDWKSVKEMVLSMLNTMPWLDYAGFDIALTNDGIRVIEINSLPGLDSPQLGGRPLLVRPKVRRFFKVKGLDVS